MPAATQSSVGATSPSAGRAAGGSGTGAFNNVAFEKFLETRNESTAVTERRRAAFARYQELLQVPLDPEEWKRVDARAFRPDQFAIQPLPFDDEGRPLAGHSPLLADKAELAGAVSHVDGYCTQSRVAKDLVAKGVLFGDLARLVEEHPDTLLPHFMTKAVNPGTDRFSAWHAAFWTGGTVLYVPRNLEIEQPLYSLIAMAREQAADFSHTLIVLEDGASATLLEETSSASADAAGVHVGAVELIVGAGARLRYVQVQNWGPKVWHFAHQSGRVGRDAELQWTVAGLGSRLAHIHQDVHLDGAGSHAEVNGVTFATGKQVLSYYTQQTHHAPNTKSDLLYKDVVRDESRVIWRGMIKVDAAAQKTDGYQRNDSLLLSATSRADAIPGLEIEADDVRCTHGATVGRVDEEQVFYLMCRGLSRHEAMHMIVEGFFQRVYDRIPVEIVKETLNQAVVEKLGFGNELPTG